MKFKTFLVNLSEYDILTYTGKVNENYLNFLSKIGKIFSVIDNRNISSGGIDRNGSNGKYSIFYQENLFQITFHISHLIKIEQSKLYMTENLFYAF